MTQALALPLAFFIAAFMPEHSAHVFAMAGLFSVWGNNYDDWAMQIQKEYGCGHRLIWMSQRKFNTSYPIWWPQPWVVVPEKMKGTLDIVILEDHGAMHRKPIEGLRSYILTVAFDMLKNGGKLVIVDNRKVLTVIEK